MSKYVYGLLVVALAALAAAPARAEETKSDWTESYPKALEQAKENGGTVLADFTGSDWCGFCIRLKKDVFDTEEFKTYAKEHKLALLELDYPRAKQQSEEIKKQNAELKKKFEIRGFPTIIFLDKDGKELGRVVGFGGKEWWWEKVKAILDKK